MSKTEQIQRLYDEISRQNNWYMWTVDILVTIVVALAGLFYFVQLKLTKAEIEQVKKDLRKEFEFDKFQNESSVWLNGLLAPFNNVTSLRPAAYSITDTALLLSCLSSLKQISELKDNHAFKEMNNIPQACWELLTLLDPKLKR